MKTIFLGLVLILACCNCKSKPHDNVADSTFERLSLEIFTRVMEPYVIGGEEDTRLWAKVESTAKEFGDRNISRELKKLSPKKQGAFKFFLSRQFLNKLGYQETIMVLSLNNYTNYPAAKAAKVAFNITSEDFFATRGW